MGGLCTDSRVALNKAKAQIVTAWWVEGDTAFPNPMSKPYMWDPKPERKKKKFVGGPT